MSEKIIVVIPRDWDKPTTVSVEGVPGPSCLDKTANLERVLGGAVTRDYKPEFNEVPEALTIEGEG